MPTIRISDESMQRLKAWAEPLVDTADSALAKALDAAECKRDQASSSQKPAIVITRHSGGRPGRRLPWQEFEEPILLALFELDGSALREDVFAALRPHIKERLLPGDLERSEGGKERWRLTARDTRPRLIQKGYLRDDSPRGVWALSEKGVALVESRLAETSDNIVDHLRAMPDAGDDSDFDRSSS